MDYIYLLLFVVLSELMVAVLVYTVVGLFSLWWFYRFAFDKIYASGRRGFNAVVCCR